MLKHDYMQINKEGHLMLGGCDTVDLCKQYGTPLYAFDEDRIRSNMRAYKNSIDAFYGGKGLCLYASKAFSTMYMYKLATEEGLGVDVVSGGELYTALKAGFDPAKIVFHGNNKSYDEIEMAIEAGVGRIVVDGDGEIEKIDKACKKSGKTASILVRVKPGVDAHTHEFISTGHIDCKFGFAISNGEADNFLKYAASFSDRISIRGLHCHIGSQIFLYEPFSEAARIMIDFYIHAQKEYGLSFTELDLGGGFGIKYVEGDTPVPFEGYIERVSKVIKESCNKEGIEIPFIYMEPGRSIVGDAGITLYSVGTVKDIKGVRKFVSVDGGMADNPRYILYSSEYDATLANRANDEPEEHITLCGKCCESGDILIEKCHLPKVKEGDLVAVMTTGAYNYSMASNYNRLPRPCAVMVSNGKHKLIIKRETYDDIIKNDLL